MLGIKKLSAISLAILSCSITAQAADTDLGSFGETELQQNMGHAVQTVCGGFVVNQDAASAQQVDLFTRCGEMVHSANELLDKTVIGRSLGVSGQELANILQQIAGEEVAVQGGIATDTLSSQQAMVAGRISSLINKIAHYDAQNDDYYALQGNKLGIGASSDKVANDEKLGVFANFSGGSGDKDATDREDGFDLNGGGFVVGLDYRADEKSVYGASLSFDKYDADYNKSARVTGGDSDIETTTFSLYGLSTIDNYYMSGILSFGSTDYEMSRRINYSSNKPLTSQGANRRLKSETSGDHKAIAFDLGYQMVDEGRTINPFVKINYQDIEIDGFSESDSAIDGGLGLMFNSQDIESLRATLGVQASWVKNQDFGVLTPYVSGEWHYEFKDDSRPIVAQYIHDPRNNKVNFFTDDPDSNFFNFSAGVSAVFEGGLQGFVDVSAIVGMEDFSYQSITIGIRHPF